MSEAKPVTVERARETLERFIAEHERVVAELREKLDEQVQITARIAELEALFRENARKAREQAAFEAAGAWDDAAAAIDQQLAKGGEG